jgi:hypothetical protein
MATLLKVNAPTVITMVSLLNPHCCRYREFVSEILDIVVESLVDVGHYLGYSGGDDGTLRGPPT